MGLATIRIPLELIGTAASHNQVRCFLAKYDINWHIRSHIPVLTATFFFCCCCCIKMEQCEKPRHLLLGEEELGSINSAAHPVKRWLATKQQWWKHNSNENCFNCFSARCRWIQSVDGSGGRCQSAQHTLLYRTQLGYVADPWSQSQDYLRWQWAEGHSMSQIQIGFAATQQQLQVCRL